MILVWSGWGDGRAEREGEVGERLGGLRHGWKDG